MSKANASTRLPDTRAGATLVKFGDMAQNVTDRIDPAEADGDVYVGLEHLDAESLKIRRWGTPADVIGQKLRFRKGDIIFGKRRAYQRKLAVAECDGICSAHAMVVRAKPKVVLPDFLPFLMQSDMFMERAVEISVGSLSPTINWKSLKVQEFPLPPLDEQRRIAEILWAADSAAESVANSVAEVGTAKRVLLNRATTRGLNGQATRRTRLGEIASGWEIAPVGELVDVCQYGLSIPLHESGQYPILRMMNYDDGRIVANDLKYVDLSEKVVQAFRLESGDLLFNRTNSADLVGKVGIFRLDGAYVFASYLVRLRARKDRILPDYLNYYLNSDLGQRRLLAFATPGVSQTNISAGNLRKVLVPVPTVEEQRKIVNALLAMDRGKDELREHSGRAIAVRNQLLNHLLGGQK